MGTVLGRQWPPGYRVVRSRSRGGYWVVKERHGSRATAYFDTRPTPADYPAHAAEWARSMARIYEDVCAEFGVTPDPMARDEPESSL